MSLPTIKKQINNSQTYFLPGFTEVDDFSFLGFGSTGSDEAIYGACTPGGDLYILKGLKDFDPVGYEITLRHECDHWVQQICKEITIYPPKREFMDIWLQVNKEHVSLYRYYLLDPFEWEVHLRDFLHLAMLQGMTREEVLRSNFSLKAECSYQIPDQLKLFQLVNFRNELLKQIVDLWWEN